MASSSNSREQITFKVSRSLLSLRMNGYAQIQVYAIKGHSYDIMVLNSRRDWDNKWHAVKIQGIQQTQLHSMNLIKEGLVCCRKKTLSCSPGLRTSTIRRQVVTLQTVTTVSLDLRFFFLQNPVSLFLFILCSSDLKSKVQGALGTPCMDVNLYL